MAVIAALVALWFAREPKSELHRGRTTKKQEVTLMKVKVRFTATSNLIGETRSHIRKGLAAMALAATFVHSPI